MSRIKENIRNIKDFPKKGIVFRDITTILKDKDLLKESIVEMIEPFKNMKIDKVVGVESRGFIFGTAIAILCNAAFVPIRKKGKLPYDTISESYLLEYGEDSIEIHKDAISEGENVLVVDDLLATGGTVNAALKLVEKLKANIIGVSFLIELSFLSGMEKISKYNVHSVVKYDSE